MMALETINITIPNECHSFSLLGKLSGDPKMYFSAPEKSNSTPASALISESAHPYKITYFCSNGKHNPMCTTHSKDQCYSENPHLRPPCQNIKRKNQASAHLSTAPALSTGNQVLVKPQELIINFGATHHMFNSLKYFTYFIKTPEISVRTGDSASTLVSAGIGTVVILCGNQTLSLKNSLFVPRLNCNLVSLLAISQKKVIIHQKDYCFRLETDDIGTIEGRITNILMHVEHFIPETHLTAAASSPWNERLGHPGNQAIRSMGLPATN
ncbi:hypothetical protein O181_018437 [Austropuccinia psidii MF-1]|uniref:Retrovirus-related Pol polyprotein from transposon TNT 1-94-like beta-barrel domain-containing protein n=1 Tax=Austropuccinia psidii MF-1 TaxID=1389203 RepID=A0A9Q3GTI5_9BASI|nr:hypothetical protein [Austropuccinia psidii MF-1]